jgi:60 kDa SS-A/Ro ribonucleoprotein
MRLNRAAYPFGPSTFTHEGAPAKRITPEQELRRLVMACLLWEDGFYEDGKSVAERIEELSVKIAPETLAKFAVEARHEQRLRHVPLLLLKGLIRRGGPLVAPTIEKVVSRADELAELVAIYWDGKNKKMLPAQMKKGLAAAFRKFDAYALGKYNRDAAVKLRDVLFLAHAKPRDEEQAQLWKKLIDGTLESPDTWEVQLSGGADKKETFERLIREGKLGYFALLRNLRGMLAANVETDLIRRAILERKNGADKVLPFRYVAAARAAPQLEPEIDAALCESIGQSAPLSGKTIMLVDVSGSMDAPLSAKSDMRRIDAAAALASVVNGDLRVFTFSDALVEVPPRRGMAGVDAVIRSQPHSGTQLGAAMTTMNRLIKADRIVVITDEQSHDRVPDPNFKHAWMINVAANRNGVGYGRWRHIDGWSDSVIRFIAASENDDAK